MRNADLNKHYKEEKPGLTKFVRTRLLLVSLLIICSRQFAQVNINGFCRYEHFKTTPGFTKIFHVDYNNDNLTDLIFADVKDKNVVLHQALANNNFAPAVQRFYYMPISEIKLFNKSRIGGGASYFFVSRINRKVGLAFFSSTGSIQLSSQQVLETYPANISVADVNEDAKNEALISGSAFQGLSLFKEINNRIKRIVITNDNSYSDAQFIDLDYDGYPDIAAVNLFTNSIVFFYNDQDGNFQEYRDIKFEAPLNGLKSVDINSDGYIDLMFIKKNGFGILLGDSVSSFKTQKDINTKVQPDKYEVFDLNSDKQNDVVYTDKKGNLFILFADGKGSFYPPMKYLYNRNISDFAVYRDKAGTKIAALSSDGNYYIIRKMNLSEDETDIKVSPSPKAITYFDYQNDGRKDICFVDSVDSSLDLLISEKKKQITKYFRYPLSKAYDNILVDDKDAGQKTFFCYNYGEPVIEVLRTDFSSNKPKRKLIYTPAPIADIRIAFDKSSNQSTLVVLTKKLGKLGLFNYDSDNFRYNIIAADSIASNTLDAAIDPSYPTKIYYWQNDGNKILLNLQPIVKNLNEQEMIMSFNMKTQGNFYTIVKSIPVINSPYEYSISLLNIDDNSLGFVYNGTRSKRINWDKDFKFDFGLGKKSVQYFTEKGQRSKYVYIYNKAENSIYSIEISSGAKELNPAKVVVSHNINSYFVTNFFPGKTNLIFSDNTDACISIRNIK